VTAARTQRLFVTDCEGPLTRNDNAMEVSAAFVPDGAELFARLSRYDDFLADVLHKPGYNAGDTLRLIVPFLLAYGVSDSDVEAYSADTVLLVPGARELLRAVGATMPSYIISTSYTPYIRALSRVVGFPFANCRCTALDLDGWHLTRDEADWLRDRAAAILEAPLIEIPAFARSAADLSAADRATVTWLDRLFWEEMGAHGRRSAEIVAAVRPIGGGLKLSALREIAALRRTTLSDVMYVGDSITDAPPFEAVRRAGGVSLSFNGNGYALAAAEFAVASADTSPTLELALAFGAGGREGFRAAARARPATTKPLPKVGLLSEAGAALAHASAYARSHVRGERAARLG
jgi:predicted HAD superfamily phosphohydrolase